MFARWIPTLRAVVAALLVVGHLAVTGPYHHLTWEAVSAPSYAQREIERWSRWLGGVDPDSVGWWYRRWAYAADGALGWVRAPLRPLYGALGVNQRWTLFAVIGTVPCGVVVEADRGDGWEVLYRRNDPEHAWHDAQLRYRRIRGVWGGVDRDAPKGTYKRMARWIARSVFAEEPDVDQVRVLVEEHRLTPPWEAADPSRTRRAERTYRRDEVGP